MENINEKKFEIKELLNNVIEKDNQIDEENEFNSLKYTGKELELTYRINNWT